MSCSEVKVQQLLEVQHVKHAARGPHAAFKLSGLIIFTIYTITIKGYAVAQLVEALRYKPEGRGFDSRWNHWNFSLT